MHIITPPAPAFAAPKSVTLTDIPFSLLRRPYRPLTASDRIRIERDIEGVAERLNALLATVGGVHV